MVLEEYPIYHLPSYTNEAKATGSVIGISNMVREIRKRLKEGTMKEPIRLSGNGASVAVHDILRSLGIEVYFIREKTLRKTL